MIVIRYFARLRERLGQDQERLERPAEIGSVADLLVHLRRRGEPWASALGESETLLTAVNQELARPDTALRDGDEVAIFPPVTGG
ncbi:MAG: molybdopterin converting factor subunit 1 [Sphingobacteriia bacterium]|nr:molybdopterin converting factor subunit 1 [Sphingobacteriia bacterium]NCC39188.1 molybdopterin converting factor subunit 1 [Gammaproteobacteria bacterium]